MKESDKIGKKAALLSVIEIGLGSVLYSLKIPFSGHFLSLNQGLILTRTCIEIDDPKAPSYVSTVSALLKSLSPAGRKLTPMLAIAAQGQLFSLGVLILGNNFLGRILGIILLSLWGFIQPLCIYLLLFGKDFLFLIDYFVKSFSQFLPVKTENLIEFLVAIILTKIILAIIVGICAQKMNQKQLESYANWVTKRKIKKRKLSSRGVNQYIMAFKDLLNPLFVLSLIIVAFFFIYSNSPKSQMFWALMRPIASGYLVFLTLRIFPIEKYTEKLKEGKYKEILTIAVSKIK